MSNGLVCIFTRLDFAMKKVILLSLLLSGINIHMAGQDAPRPRTQDFHLQVQAGGRLMGRKDLVLSEDRGGIDVRYNEQYGLGVSGYWGLGSNAAVGGTLDYTAHALGFDYAYRYMAHVPKGVVNVLLHAVQVAPSIRWQQGAMRGAFVQLAVPMSVALGTTGSYWYDPVLRGNPPGFRQVLEGNVPNRDRLVVGPEFSVGGLVPMGQGGALSLRASIWWYKRNIFSPNNLIYPEMPFAVRPGLEVGWRWP